ncbi:hypothetical protein [Paenibacillus eucommiae]|uniref:Uncharacterized protein n=1 Tax=Paenibacillus eucommiae TaxID=1355755 RepID=A0ABS4IZQ1_9BACL|nr:hypothetical protein [Paenibacillus eucommiae]MBP1993068.1 hypothetical protein [Paenibacillus eucommiae]
MKSRWQKLSCLTVIIFLSLSLISVHVSTYAAPLQIDTAEDGIHIDDVVKYINQSSPSPGEISNLLSQIRPLSVPVSQETPYVVKRAHTDDNPNPTYLPVRWTDQFLKIIFSAPLDEAGKQNVELAFYAAIGPDDILDFDWVDHELYIRNDGEYTVEFRTSVSAQLSANGPAAKLLELYPLTADLGISNFPVSNALQVYFNKPLSAATTNRTSFEDTVLSLAYYPLQSGSEESEEPLSITPISLTWDLGVPDQPILIMQLSADISIEDIGYLILKFRTNAIMDTEGDSIPSDQEIQYFPID